MKNMAFFVLQSFHACLFTTCTIRGNKNKRDGQTLFSRQPFSRCLVSEILDCHHHLGIKSLLLIRNLLFSLFFIDDDGVRKMHPKFMMWYTGWLFNLNSFLTGKSCQNTYHSLSQDTKVVIELHHDDPCKRCRTQFMLVNCAQKSYSQENAINLRLWLPFLSLYAKSANKNPSPIESKVIGSLSVSLLWDDDASSSWYRSQSILQQKKFGVTSVRDIRLILDIFALSIVEMKATTTPWLQYYSCIIVRTVLFCEYISVERIFSRFHPFSHDKTLSLSLMRLHD